MGVTNHSSYDGENEPYYIAYDKDGNIIKTNGLSQ